jgi:hypothetical protein
MIQILIKRHDQIFHHYFLKCSDHNERIDLDYLCRKRLRLSVKMTTFKPPLTITRRKSTKLKFVSYVTRPSFSINTLKKIAIEVSV